MKSEIISSKYGPFVHEPGMWWNLDMFGKFAFEVLFGPRGLLVFMGKPFFEL